MSRLELKASNKSNALVDKLSRNMDHRLAGTPPTMCPVDAALSALAVCQAQTCGKCVPCRIGLAQLSDMIREVLEGTPDLGILKRIEETAEVIVDSADCVIGIESAQQVLTSIRGFREDYESHVKQHRCISNTKTPVPCVALCPADVDIPGYIALVKDGRPADAVRLIRKDNPFPTACAYVCEHPCENRCRRTMVDAPVSIRALKLYAVENSGEVPQPACAPATGKKVAVVGGGPSGLTAAYYLALMGHKVTVYDQRKQLGGMLRYGIPSYRFPRERLDEEIASILSLGIEAHTDVKIGVDITMEQLKQENDAVYLAIGAHTDKKVGIDGEDSKGVISAVDMLRRIGDNDLPDFTGKNVVVVGGGNVAMDCTRTSVRLGAKKVTCVYRRRKEDMTALMEEVDGAVAEGAELLTLQAPMHIEADENGNAVALWTQPQIIGYEDNAGRPRPNAAAVPEQRIPADIIVVAIGQGIESRGIDEGGVKIQRGGTLLAGSNTVVPDLEGVFAGGDCVTGPATAIRAIAAGKVAAANIDEYLGYHHEISVDVEIPTAGFSDMKPHGRVLAAEREAGERSKDFGCIEGCFTDQEAAEEANRCLRCDHYGYGCFKGGRVEKW